MSVSRFLDALFSPTKQARFDGEVFERFDADLSGYRYVDPLTSKGAVAFVFNAYDDAEADDWRKCRTEPTVALYRDDGTLICAWALEDGDPTNVEPLVQAFDMAGPDDLIPLPGDGWEMVRCFPDAIYRTQDIISLYGTAEADDDGEDDTPPWDDEVYGTARVLTPYNEADPKLAREITISMGRNSEAKQWKPRTMPLGALVAMFCEHKEGDKDGLSILLGDMVPGARKKTAIKSLYVVGLDLDDGLETASLDAKLKKLGVLAVRYSTHSHLKSETHLPREGLMRWAVKQGREEDEPTDELVRDFYRDRHKLSPAVIESMKITGERHESSGRMVVISHLPIAKHRVLIPLEAPFVIADEGRTAAEAHAKWAKVPQAVADRLGVTIDKACLDVSRLFYLPRHPKGGKHETSLFGGPLLDWRDLQLDDAWATELESMGKGKSKSTTEAGRSLGRWSIGHAHGFQIAQAVEDLASEKCRGPASIGITAECPFDEEHSNAGDPEDMAFFCVNAGDGPSEIFTAHCRHDSCRERTNLDFLGKMIEDGWFGDADVLTDEDYNLAEIEDASDPETAQKIETVDRARAEYEEAIAALEPGADDEVVEEAFRKVIEAGLSALREEAALASIKAKLGVTMASVRRGFKAARAQHRDESGETEAKRDPHGRIVFSYQGDFNFDEAFETCFRALLKANREAGEPLFSCLQDKPVRLRRQEDGRVVFDEITASRTLWSELNERVTFVRRMEQGEGARQQVPIDVATHVYETAWKRLPVLPEVLYTPCFSPEGELIRKPGYYKDLNIVMADTGFRVPKVSLEPDPEEVADAVWMLRDDMLADFPFLDYDAEGEERREPSCANALAMIITPFMRRMIDGCTPLFFISKPEPGTGGTALGLLSMLLFDGVEPAPLRYSQNEEEMQKMLLAAFLETRSHMFFDDVVEFNNRALLQSLTARNVGGRVLGSTKTAERPNNANWIATGNNPIIMSEMARRIVDVRLNLKNVDVQNRSFRHPHLFSFVKENRGDLVWAILTLIQNWIALGEPRFEERSRASFEDWGAKVGGVLMSAGVEGFLDNTNRRKLADMNDAAIREFAHDWLKRFGKMNPQSMAELFSFAMDAGLDICDGNNDDQKKSRFMRRLPAMEERTFRIDGQDYMVRSVQAENGSTSFYLQQLETVAEAA